MGDRAAKGVDRVGVAERAVAVTARAGEGDLVTVAADAPIGDAVRLTGFDGDEVVDLTLHGYVEELFHAAQIAEALLAYVGDEGERPASLELGVLHGANDGEQGGETATIVADARTFEGVADARDVDIGLGGKDGVEVGGDDEVRVRSGARSVAEDIACLVDTDVGQPGGFEEACDLGGTLVFVKGRRGDLTEADLFLNEVRLAGFNGLHCPLYSRFGEDLIRGLGSCETCRVKCEKRPKQVFAEAGLSCGPGHERESLQR